MHLTLKVDYLCAFSESKLLPRGPRVYFGFLFTTREGTRPVSARWMWAFLSLKADQRMQSDGEVAFPVQISKGVSKEGGLLVLVQVRMEKDFDERFQGGV